MAKYINSGRPKTGQICTIKTKDGRTLSCEYIGIHENGGDYFETKDGERVQFHGDSLISWR